MQELYRINVINTDNGWDNCSAYYTTDKKIFDQFSSYDNTPDNWFDLLEENEVIIPKFPFILLGDVKAIA